MQLETMDELYARLDALVARGGRRILGLTGPPGAGKSTLARRLASRFPDIATIVPMDGYHLANAELARLGRSDRKGAPDTFDAAGYVALLRRLRDTSDDDIVYAPEFAREIEEAIAGAIPVDPTRRLIVTEGNYLLLDSGPWRHVRELIDEIWYVEVDPAVRLAWLIARHIRFGRDERAAREWVSRSDERNAEIIAGTRDRADTIVRVEPSANQ